MSTGVLQLLDVPLGDGHAGKKLLHMDAVAASVGLRSWTRWWTMRGPWRSWRAVSASSAGHLEEDPRRDALDCLGGRLLRT